MCTNDARIRARWERKSRSAGDGLGIPRFVLNRPLADGGAEELVLAVDQLQRDSNQSNENSDCCCGGLS